MRLPFLPTDGLCRRCGRAAVGLNGEFLCEDCRTHPPHFDRAGSALRFENEARELVNAFKFRERTFLRDDLVDFLEGMVRTRFRTDEIACVVPMPATFSHRWLRGYNPARVIAHALACRLDMPCRDLLRRTGHPSRQGGLDEDARRKNVINTFAANVRGCQGVPTVLVVDDIMTTGSTLSEAARTLKASGVDRVWTATIAHSIRD